MDPQRFIVCLFAALTLWPTVTWLGLNVYSGKQKLNRAAFGYRTQPLTRTERMAGALATAAAFAASLSYGAAVFGSFHHH